MGWKLLFIFFAVAAALDEDLDYPDSYNPACMEQVYRQCEMKWLNSPVGFPENKEELQEQCTSILGFADCGIDIFENCDASDEIAKPFYTARTVFTNICDENSKLFEIVEQNLKCFGDNWDYFHEPCPLTPGETQDLNDLVNAFSAADEEAFLNADMCLESLARFGCFVTKVGNKCSKQAVDALIEILQQLEKPFERCGEGVRENLPLIAGIITIEEELEEDIQELKKKRR